MIIYKTTNKINGKFYIGFDTKNNPDYLGSGLRLDLAIKKYGKENFVKEILEICENEKQLSERERFWIKETRAVEIGYNISEGGDGGNLGEEVNKKRGEKLKGRIPWNKGKKGIYSKETLMKISKRVSESLKGKYIGKNSRNYGRKRPDLSEINKRKIGKKNPMFGRHLTEEHKKLISEKVKGEKHPNYGKHRSEETKRKISESLRKK